MLKIFSLLVLLANILIINANSWNGYVDKLLEDGFKQVAVLGSDALPFATSSGFQIKPAESNQITKLFQDPTSAYASGFNVNGIKYMTIKSDGSSLYGKKGQGGAIIVKTASLYLVGVYDANLQPGSAAIAVEKLGDYLKENGY